MAIEESELDYKWLHSLSLIFLIILVIISLFEIGIFVYAYINADKVECNFLGCTFTSGDIIEIKDGYKLTNITTTSQCYINNEEINCSEIKDYEDKYLKLIP